MANKFTYRIITRIYDECKWKRGDLDGLRVTVTGPGGTVHVLHERRLATYRKSLETMLLTHMPDRLMRTKGCKGLPWYAMRWDKLGQPLGSNEHVEKLLALTWSSPTVGWKEWKTSPPTSSWRTARCASVAERKNAKGYSVTPNRRNHEPHTGRNTAPLREAPKGIARIHEEPHLSPLHGGPPSVGIHAAVGGAVQALSLHHEGRGGRRARLHRGEHSRLRRSHAGLHQRSQGTHGCQDCRESTQELN